jgi:hypothetical protein
VTLKILSQIIRMKEVNTTFLTKKEGLQMDFQRKENKSFLQLLLYHMRLEKLPKKENL